MSNRVIRDLTDCTEFRQALLARPPRIVHGTVTVLAALLATALAWLALTRADLVVCAPGRARPVTSPHKVIHASRPEVLSASAGGRVVAVNFQEGDEVRQGDVLVRLDTARLDNEIAKRQRNLQTIEEELAKLARLEELSARQFEAARARAEAELAQAEEEVRQAKVRQAVDVRLAQVELDSAADEEGRLRQLVARRAAAESELVKAAARAQEAREKLARAQLPVEEGKVEVLRRGLTLAERDDAVRREELALKRAAKQGELAAARLELVNLELERKQSVLCAPTDGVVTRGDVKVGDILDPGKVVVEVAGQKGFHFEALVPSEEVGHLRVGLPARIKLDAYDYQQYGTLDGTVVFISSDSGVPEGQRTALYVVKIAVEGSEVGRGDLRGRVKLGMAGRVEIVTGQESLLGLLVKKIRQTISLG